MKKINVKYSKDAELTQCFNSAYNDLQILLQDAFINISRLPNQLTFDELFTLFERYDWNDLFDKFEELENTSEASKNGSLFSILTESLKCDQNIRPLTDPRENSYYKVWAGLIRDEDF